MVTRWLHFCLWLGGLFTLGALLRAQEIAPRTVLVLGDSLTAGYGLEDPATEGWPGRVQARITAEGLPWRVVNAGVSGDTTSGGLRRIDWVLRQPVDVLVLELGANDGLRGLPLDMVERNLVAIVQKARDRQPQIAVVLAGMKMPANMGDYATEFNALFPQLAAREGWTLIPYLLDGVGGVPELNLADGIHPNPEGHARVTDNVWPVIAPLLRGLRVPSAE
jgi:acyl-CoA thioesterase I